MMHSRTNCARIPKDEEVGVGKTLEAAEDDGGVDCETSSGGRRAGAG
jgi:hypothetical protein